MLGGRRGETWGAETMSDKPESTPDSSRTPVDHARGATDERLQAERKQADRLLHQKIERREEKTDESLDMARKQADHTAEHAREQAKQLAVQPAQEAVALEAALDRAEENGHIPQIARQAIEEARTLAADAVQAEREKALAAVEEISDATQEAIEAERERADLETSHEREARRRIFQEVLSRERTDTDNALAHERSSADKVLRYRDEVLAMVSHDLRNLVNAIGLKAALLNQSFPEAPPRLKRLTEDIALATKIIARWADDLVDLATIDEGMLTIRIERHDPRELIEAALQTFSPAASAKGISMKTDVPEKSPRVLCDRDRIVQVLSNLLDNALKFTPQEGSIQVRLEVVEDGLRFSVSDTGPGIAEQDLPRIFDRFWHRSKGSMRSSGLGLFICKQLIERHDGKIWVESKPGCGTTVFFALPADRHASE